MMEIIKYNELKSRKKILLSTSIFKMLQEYRRFSKYLGYLSILIDKFYLNEYVDIRIYFDDSCQIELKPFIKKYKDVEFYKFNFEPLRIEIYHTGTFGSLARLLPVHENEYEFVWISDLEPPKWFLDESLMKKINNNELNTIFASKPYYDVPWVNIKNKFEIINYIIITNQKIPIKIFNTFLADLLTNKYNTIRKKCIQYRKNYYNNDMDNELDSKFPYGMDEYYTNNILYNYLLVKKTFIINDINPILLIRKIVKNYELMLLMYNFMKKKHIQYKAKLDFVQTKIEKTKKESELIILIQNLCVDIYNVKDSKIITDIINTIKSLIKKVGEDTLLNSFSENLKEQKSLKYIIDLLIKENINSFYLIKNIII